VLALGAPSCGFAGNPPADEPNNGPPPGYHLVWADEFDHGDAPDPANWRYDDFANSYTGSGGELQYYASNRRENARIEHGVLVIEARKEDLVGAEGYTGQHYSSARLITSNLHDWTYGYFEVRARFSCAYGAWPAIWTLGVNGSWPDQGEIDIMEHIGREPGIVRAAVHTGAYNHTSGNARGASEPLAQLCDDHAFHLYQMLWMPNEIEVGVDHHYYFQLPRQPNDGHDAWPFNQGQYLLLNLAVGGWGGDTNRIDPTSLPWRFEVDYVRVYQDGQANSSQTQPGGAKIGG
jgi:beta-glucanase (GH16 family)